MNYRYQCMTLLANGSTPAALSSHMTYIGGPSEANLLEPVELVSLLLRQDCSNLGEGVAMMGRHVLYVSQPHSHPSTKR